MSKPSALSPSRAKTFLNCPLQFRFQVIDKIPTKPTMAKEKGTLVHAALENLFLYPAQQRNLALAISLLPQEWEKITAKNPLVEDQIFKGKANYTALMGEAEKLLEHYFGLENPQGLEPLEREMYIRTQTRSGLNLHGYIDRVDKSPQGWIRIIDYKTGKCPNPRYIGDYLFQMRFYALSWYLLHGEVPKRLQLLFLGNQQSYSYDPTLEDIRQCEHELENIWQQIADMCERKIFPARRNNLCSWCDYQSYCPLFAGQTPDLPEAALSQLLTTKSSQPPLH